MYKKIGDYIRQVDIRNKNLEVENLLGVSIQKIFMPSIANIVGTDLSKYKIVRKNQFAYGPVTSRNGDKVSIALLEDFDEAIVSVAYTVFEVIDTDILLPEYLMMWFRRPEFDRYARFKSHGSAREIFDWEEMCDTEIPLPDIEKQKEIVAEYTAVVDRINLNEKMCAKLEETAQAVYREWFVDFEPDNLEKLDEYVEFNPSHSISKNSLVSYVEMADLQEDRMGIKKVIKRKFTSGSKFQNNDTLLARITPCLENGKTAFVNCLKDEETAYGSTEFIVMRAKENISPFWIYCLARDENFRSHAISSMVGSSGRQRVHSDYLKEFDVCKIENKEMGEFHKTVSPFFQKIKNLEKQTQSLQKLKSLLLARIAGNF